MASALAEAALSRPRALLVWLIAGLLLAGLVGAGAPSRLGLPAVEPADTESATTEDELSDALGREPDPGMIVLTHANFPVRSGVYQVPLDVISSQAEAQPEVATVRPGPASRDRRTTALQVYFDTGDEAAQQRAVDEIERNLDPGPLNALVGGREATALEARQTAERDVWRLALLALPLALLVLVAALGVRLAAGPVLAAATAIVGTLALLRVAGWIADVSVIGILPGAAVGLVLGVEYCLALAARYREEVQQLREGAAALRRTVETTGRTILRSSLVATGAAAGLVLIPMTQARSVALGAAIAAMLAALGALVAMPSLISLYGGRLAGGDAGEGKGARWRRLTGIAAARRSVAIAATAITVVMLAIAALPLLRGETVALGATALPDGADARRAEGRATRGLGPGVTAPVLVAGEPGRPADAVRVRDELRDLDGVASAARPERLEGGVELVSAGLDAAPESLDARRAVERIRAAPIPYETSVGGRDAAALDGDRALFDHLPLAALAAALLAGALLFRLVAHPAALSAALAGAALLPAAAAAGLLVLTFQDDRLTALLDYAGQGAVQLGALVALFAALLPISAARGALFAAACAERRSAGPGIAVRRGLSLTLPGMAAASVIGVGAAGVLAGSGLLPLKELGLGLAAALLLDAVLVRGLLVPSVARLLPARQP